jgi:hypothetical protein
VAAQSFYPGVIATGTQGPTNPPQATMGTSINQTSMARLLSANSVDVSILNNDAVAVVDDLFLGLLSFCAPNNAKRLRLRGMN